MIQKCQYFNDHHAAAVLMLDDLSLTATTLDGDLTPGCDWGYGLNGKGSLYGYLRDTLLARYPEIKGTFFFPIHAHAAQNPNAGYRLLSREVDDAFTAFLAESSGHFELAFHGTDHGKFLDPENPSFANWKHEFEMLGAGDEDRLRGEIRKAEERLGMRFQGGKYPGYRSGASGPVLVEALGFRWWSSSAEMLNRKHPHNAHGYLSPSERTLEFPTNFGGNAFNRSILSDARSRGMRGRMAEQFKQWRLESHLQYLYEAGLVISIQEHLQNLRTDGLRQTPNIYDDLESLERIYATLRSGDIWHADCTRIARYLESHDHSRVVSHPDGSVSVEYSGGWEEPSLSLRSDSRTLQDPNSGRELHGVYRNGAWIFNHIKPGRYRPSRRAA